MRVLNLVSVLSFNDLVCDAHIFFSLTDLSVNVFFRILFFLHAVPHFFVSY